MIGSFLKKGLNKHYRTEGEPRSLNIGQVILAPLWFAIFIALVSVGTNTMPFYSDGSRMNLMDGLGTVLMEEKGEFTAPYAVPEGGPAYTDVAAPGPESDFYLDDQAAWGVPATLGNILKVDNLTAFILIIFVVMMIFSFVINAFSLPFIFTEKTLHSTAFNPKISNAALKSSFWPVTAPAILINMGVSFAIGMVFLNLTVSDFEGQGISLGGFVIHPYSFVAVLFFAFFWVRDLFSSRRFLSNLLSRRCRNCFHMDTLVIIGKEYVRTDVTTTTTYRETTDGLGHKSRTQTGTRKSSHDVYDYTYQCQNCGDTFVSRY